MKAFKEKQFTSRYNKIFLLTFIAVILIATALTSIKLNAEINFQRQELSEQFHNRRLAIDNLIVSAKQHVNMLHAKAEGYLRDDHAGQSPLLPSLRQTKLKNVKGEMVAGYALDNVPEKYKFIAMIGAGEVQAAEVKVANLTGYGDIKQLDPDVQEELNMALSLNNMFLAAKSNIENSSWVYYTSKNKFINIYPYVTSGDFCFSEELFTHEFYRWGCPFENKAWGCTGLRPDIQKVIDEGWQGKKLTPLELRVLRRDPNSPFKRMFWTPAYIDQFGQGMMVTAAKPVYRGVEFLGTVAIDVTLDELKGYVQDFADRDDSLMIVDSEGTLIAHSTLVSSQDTEVKPLSVALPDVFAGKENLLSDLSENGLQRQGRVFEYEGYDYMWAELENAPWKLIYVNKTKSVFLGLFSSVGIVFLVLLLGLAYLLFATKRLTYKEFIHPAENLVRHISQESKNEPSEVPLAPSAWMPWFDEISKTFAENRTMMKEIKEKNEMLTEMNVSLERYMPKFILLVSFHGNNGSSSLGNMFASKLASKDREKASVYLEYPKPESIAEKFGLDASAHIYRHPNGYDIWNSYDLGVAPEDAVSSLLMTKVLNNYSNIVINVAAQAGDEKLMEQLTPMFPYAKAIVIMAPTDGSDSSLVRDMESEIHKEIRQDKTNVYTLVNHAEESSHYFGKCDFEIPFIPELNVGKESYETPAEVLAVIHTLVDRIERVHQVSVFIPTTVDVNTNIDADAYVQKTMVFLGELFGGATSSQAKGVWNSEEVGIVDEVVHVVVSYTTEDDLGNYMDDVIEYMRDLKEELSQEAMAIEVNKKMILV